LSGVITKCVGSVFDKDEMTKVFSASRLLMLQEYRNIIKNIKLKIKVGLQYIFICFSLKLPITDWRLLFGGKARHCQDFSICPPLTANACYGLVSGQLL